MFDAGMHTILAQRLVSIVSSVRSFDQTCLNRLVTHFNISNLACLVTKQCLMVFGRHTFLVCPGPNDNSEMSRYNLLRFYITALRDWFKKFAPLRHPIESRTKLIATRLNLFSRASRQATCILLRGLTGPLVLLSRHSNVKRSYLFYDQQSGLTLHYW